MDTYTDSGESYRESILLMEIISPFAAAKLEEKPVSRRRVARDIAEMVRQPYPNTRLVPRQDSLVAACLLLNTGTRIVHIALFIPIDYPETPPLPLISGRAGGDPRSHGKIPCYEELVHVLHGNQSYTIKTMAIHLLSMFNGDDELVGEIDGGESWFRSQWAADFSCDHCGYPHVHCNVDHDNADEYSATKTTVSGGTTQSTSIRELPDKLPTELLKGILDFLEVEDLVRFGQAYPKVQSVIEEGMIMRDRELQCFATKEHFTQSPLGIGIYLPTLPRPGLAIESEFDFMSSDAYNEIIVCNTAYGCKVDEWLPLPLSQRHWDQVKDRAYRHLRQLAAACQTRRLAGAMGVLTAFLEDQVTKLFRPKPSKESHETGLLKLSEKGIESLFFIFHLLLCVALDNPKYVDKANKMIKEFQDGHSRPKDMPSPGRMLAALLISDAETDANFLPKLVFEAVTRNVPSLLAQYPELEYMEDDGAASPYRLHHTFATNITKYRALMFMELFQRTVRGAKFGETLKDKCEFFFGRRGFPPPEVLAGLAEELPRIMAVDSFPGLLNYLGIYPNADERFLAGQLRDTVRESILRGDRAPWVLSQQDGAILRLAAEEESPLEETENLPPYPELPGGLAPKLEEIHSQLRM